jgi:hypothetical protein
MQKQRKMISFENLEPKLQEVLKEKYPNGFVGHTQRIETPKETVNVVQFEPKDTIYMVKVKLQEKKRKDDDDDDEEADLIPDVAPGLDDDKDEFGDEEEEDGYGDEPVDEASEDEDED